MPLSSTFAVKCLCTSTGGGNATLVPRANEIHAQGGPSSVVINGNGAAYQPGIEYNVAVSRA